MTVEEKTAIQNTLMWLENGDGLEIAKELNVSEATVANVRHMRGKRVNVRVLEKLITKAEANRQRIMAKIERSKPATA